MAEPTFECPACRERIDVKPGAWSSLYAQAFAHLKKCGLTPLECDRVSGEVADAIFAQDPRNQP